MKIVDANVLLYAVNEDAVHHGCIRPWWEDAISDDEPIGLCWLVLLAFIRISTNPRAFARPLSSEQAVGAVDDWLSQANTRLILEADQHWAIFKSLIEEAGTAGNLTSDAHLAALAMSHGAVLVSCDADFSRFPGLRWENPLDN